MGPIRGQTRPLQPAAGIVTEPQHIDAKLNASIHNRFDVEVVDATTGEVRQRAQAENIVLNTLFANFDTALGSVYIVLGSGSGTPAVTDTTLFTPVVSKYASRITAEIESGVYRITSKIGLSETENVGVTFTEVGIGSTTKAYTHAMLKDMNGNDISITKTSTDIINIYATIFVSAQSNTFSNDSIRVMTFKNYSSVLYNIAVGSLNIIYSAVLQHGTAFGRLTDSSDMTCTYNQSHTDGSVTGTFTYSRIPAGSFNWSGGIGAIFFNDVIRYGYLSSPLVEMLCNNKSGWYTGSDVVGEAIATGDGTAKDFATAFPLIENATVYVDGIAATCTVDTQLPMQPDDCGTYFILVPEESTLSADSDGYYVYPCGPNRSSTCGTGVWYNPYYAKGIVSFVLGAYSIVIQVSDDLVTWENLASSYTANSTFSVPEAFQHKKYWKFSGNGVTKMKSNGIKSTNIHFDTAPASGAVITANYHTPVIAKDANHVFDLTVSMTVGRYSA